MKDKYKIKERIARKKYQIELLEIKIEKINNEEEKANTEKNPVVGFHVEETVEEE